MPFPAWALNRQTRMATAEVPVLTSIWEAAIYPAASTCRMAIAAASARMSDSSSPDKAGTRVRAAACAIDCGTGDARNWLLMLCSRNV